MSPPVTVLQKSQLAMPVPTMEKSLRLMRLLYSTHTSLARKAAPLQDECEYRAAIGLRLYRSAGLDCHVIRLDPTPGAPLQLAGRKVADIRWQHHWAILVILPDYSVVADPFLAPDELIKAADYIKLFANAAGMVIDHAFEAKTLADFPIS